MNWLERLDEIAVNFLPEEEERRNGDGIANHGDDTGILIDPLLDIEYTGGGVVDETPREFLEQQQQQQQHQVSESMAITNSNNNTTKKSVTAINTTPQMLSSHDSSHDLHESQINKTFNTKPDNHFHFNIQPIAPETSMLDNLDRLQDTYDEIPLKIESIKSEQSTGDYTTEQRKTTFNTGSIPATPPPTDPTMQPELASQNRHPHQTTNLTFLSTPPDQQNSLLNKLDALRFSQETNTMNISPTTENNNKTLLSSKAGTTHIRRKSINSTADDDSVFLSPKRKFSQADSDIAVLSTPGLSVNEDQMSDIPTRDGKPLTSINLPDIFHGGLFDVHFPLSKWMDIDAPPFQTKMNCLGVVHVRVLAAKGLPCPVGSIVQPALSLLPWKGLVRSEPTTAFDANTVCVKWDALNEASGCSMVHAWNSDDTPVPTIKVNLLFKPVNVFEFSMCTLELSCEPLMRKPEFWKKQWCEATLGRTIETTKQMQNPLILIEAAFIPAQDDDQLEHSFHANESMVSGSKSISGSIASKSTFTLRTKNKPHLLKKHQYWMPASCCVCKKTLMGWKHSFQCEACNVGCCKDCQLQIDLQIPCGSNDAKDALKESLQNRITVDKVLSTIAPIDAEHERRLASVKQQRITLDDRRRSLDYDSDSDSEIEQKQQIPVAGKFEVRINRACIFQRALSLETNQQTIFDGTYTLPLRSADYYVRVSSNAGSDTRRTETVQSSGRPKFSSQEVVMDMPHYGVEYRIDVIDASTEKSVGTTLFTAQSLVQMQQDRRIEELGLNAFIPVPLKDRPEKPLKLKLELRSGLKPGFGTDYFIPSKARKSKDADIKPGSVSGWIALEACVHENIRELFGSAPVECPARPPDSLDFEMFSVHIGRISAVIKDIGRIGDGYSYMVSWKNPFVTLFSLIILINGAITFDAEYIGSLPFYFIVPGMIYVLYLRMSGYTKKRFILRETQAQIKLEKEATLNYSIHRPMGRIEVEVFKGKNLRSRELGLPGSVGCEILWDPLRYCRNEETKKELSAKDQILKAHHEVASTNYIYNANPVWNNISESAELKRIRQLLPSQGSFSTAAQEKQEVIQFPILQPICEKPQPPQKTKKKNKIEEEKDMQLGSWSESKDALVVQVCFKDVINRYANLERVLGEVAIPVSKLIENGEISGWFQVLEAGTTRVIRGSEDPGDEMPQVYIRLNWKAPEVKISDAEREASIVAAEELVRTAAIASIKKVGWIGSSINTINSVRGVGDSIQSVQNIIGKVADTLETIRNLINFTHPQKSTLILMILIFLSLLLMIIPTRVLVLLGVTGQYVATGVTELSKSRAVSNKEHDAKSETSPKSSPFAIWMANAMKSIPTDEDLRRAFFWESRRVAVQEANKVATQKRVRRLERLWKAHWYSQVELRVASKGSSSNTTTKSWHWKCSFAVIHGRRLLLWESESDFDEGHPPLQRIFLSGHAGIASLSPLEIRDLTGVELPLVVTIFGRGSIGQEKITLLLPSSEAKEGLEDAVISASLKKE